MNRIVGFGLLVCLLVLPVLVIAQNETKKEKKNKKFHADENGIPMVQTSTVYIVDKATAKGMREHRKRVENFQRLRRNVRIVYPLAKECAAIINDINADLAKVSKKGDRSKYLKRLETELFEKYQDRITNLTVTQGKILIKLIYRETGNSAFNLIEEYKSWGTATAWQVMAKIFGSNLKEDYVKADEIAIETIIQEIESGKFDGYQTTYH